MFGESDTHTHTQARTILRVSSSKNDFHTDRLDIVANCDLHCTQNMRYVGQTTWART